MINFATIPFTAEEQNEISELEQTNPDQAYWHKHFIALERLGFIIERGDYDTSTQETLYENDFLLVNKKGESLVDLFSDWISQEVKDDDMTFIKLVSPDFSNVDIRFRKQSELKTNRFNFNIKD